MWKLVFLYSSRRRFNSYSFDPPRFSQNIIIHYYSQRYFFSTDTTINNNNNNNERKGEGYDDDKYPKGVFKQQQQQPNNAWRKFMVNTRRLFFFAWPWQRFPNGTLLKIKLHGEITDQLRRSSFSKALSLPQICENFEKAAYDPRIAGIYLHIETLNCGWGKLDEVRRHILGFRKSGKFIVGYMPTCGVKEYYIGCACDELYVPPSAYVGLYGMVVQSSFVGGELVMCVMQEINGCKIHEN